LATLPLQSIRLDAKAESHELRNLELTVQTLQRPASRSRIVARFSASGLIADRSMLTAFSIGPERGLYDEPNAASIN